MKRILIVVAAVCLAVLCVQEVRAQPAFPFAATVTADGRVNLRQGPGTSFPAVARALPGDTVEVTGCNDDCSWYQLDSGLWIAAFLVRPAGNGTPSPNGPVTATPTATAGPSPTPSPSATPAVARTGAFTLTVVGWNVTDSAAEEVRARVADLAEVDVWGLAGVPAADAAAYAAGAQAAIGAAFAALLGETGGSERLLLIWNALRFTKLDGGELTAIGQGQAAPLWVLLRELATEQVLIVMVNHLHASAEQRHLQAQMLNAWAGSQSFPIVALGDYNFAWNLANGTHDRGFDDLTLGGNWQWARPATLAATTCDSPPCAGNRIDDFVFVAGPARQWPAVVNVLQSEDSFGEGSQPSHRPVYAVLAGSAPVAAPAAPNATVTPGTTAVAADPATCPRTNRNSNVRRGPGINYAVEETLPFNTCVTVDGRTDEGEWLHLAGRGWIAAYLVSDAPPAAQLPVMPAP